MELRRTLSSLTRKGFREEKGQGRRRKKYRIFRFYLKGSGVATQVTMMVRRSSRVKDLGDGHISDLARQCRLSRVEFLELARCFMTEEQYHRHLFNSGYVGRFDAS